MDKLFGGLNDMHMHIQKVFNAYLYAPFPIGLFLIDLDFKIDKKQICFTTATLWVHETNSYCDLSTKPNDGKSFLLKFIL